MYGYIQILGYQCAGIRVIGRNVAEYMNMYIVDGYYKRMA